MSKGFSGIRKIAAQQSQRSSSSFGPQVVYFKLSPEEATVVRFLEEGEEVSYCTMHEVPVEGRSWGRQEPCLDQDETGEPCPGCERELPRKFRGFINLIWFDAPVLKRDESGKAIRDNRGNFITIGNQAQVAMWASGIRLFEQLDEIDANYKGLTSRRFRVKRKGSGFDTKYTIAPEDPDSGRQPFTDEEKALAASKPDLTPFVTAKSYDDLLAEITGEESSTNGGGAPQQRPNPFMRNR